MSLKKQFLGYFIWLSARMSETMSHPHTPEIRGPMRGKFPTASGASKNGVLAEALAKKSLKKQSKTFTLRLV
jgi:hypothetical protein